MNILKPNFIYPDIKKEDYVFGQSPIIAPILKEDGDWRDDLPPYEAQRRNGVESSACYIEAQQHAIATLQEAIYVYLDYNYSARFNAFLSDGTEYGGDPLKGAYSINHDGLIPEDFMPFSDNIRSWSEYHSFSGVDKDFCIKTAKEFLEKWKLNYDIVFQRGDSLASKYSKLKQALQYSPCPISVLGITDSNRNYVPKLNGENDTHMVLATYVDEDNRIHIFDTYEPYEKILPANYNSDFCMRWSVKNFQLVENKKPIPYTQAKVWWLGLWNMIKALLLKFKTR